MTGPEHYRKAEELAKTAARYPESSDALVLAQLATAHATLALAAATALVDETPRSDSHSEYRAWSNVAGSPYHQGPEAPRG
ncbi:hypothetical protein [Streptomyces sp. NPDC006267]|uniref:hypothetical protein n=1 Tax=Streptomyces sp. NPDC006267 TaxID=3157173 RepID=UPI0033B01777